jgi:hypothetical protein
MSLRRDGRLSIQERGVRWGKAKAQEDAVLPDDDVMYSGDAGVAESDSLTRRKREELMH